MKILVGADPEFFISKNGEIVWPTPELFPGTKKEPHKVPGGAVQIDGAAIEINIEPSETADQFNENIESVMNEVFKILPADYKAERVTSHKFKYDMYNALPKEYKIIGCDPDYNVYTGKENRPYSENTLGTLRFVGGHIHIGWTENQNIKDYSHLDACKDVVKQMDCFIKPLQIFISLTDQREEYYGISGNYRPKSYGVEYRTPSNWWIWNKKDRKLIFNQVQKGMKLLVEEDKLVNRTEYSMYWPDVSASRYNYEFIYNTTLPRFLHKNKILSKEEIISFVYRYAELFSDSTKDYILNAITKIEKFD